MCNLNCRQRESIALKDWLCNFSWNFQVLLTPNKYHVMHEKSPPFSYPPLTKLSCSSLKDSHSILPLNTSEFWPVARSLWYSPGMQESKLGTNSTCVSEMGIHSRRGSGVGGLVEISLVLFCFVQVTTHWLENWSLPREKKPWVVDGSPCLESSRNWILVRQRKHV